MRAIIDRFEEDTAVLELGDGETVDVPRRILPKEAKEGDCIIISIDTEETEKRRKAAQEKLNKLFNKQK